MSTKEDCKIDTNDAIVACRIYNRLIDALHEAIPLDKLAEYCRKAGTVRCFCGCHITFIND